MSITLNQPEYRKDPLSDAWVVIAAQRHGRPEEFQELPFKRITAPCPFCRGNELATPDQIVTYPRAGQGDWKVRVVPNKFPAVVRGNLGSAEASTAFKNGTPSLYTSLKGHGGHEVIIESPEHAVSLTDLDEESLRLTFLCYRDRMQALANEGPWSYVQIFKNVGAAAGSSIEHAHSQVVGLPAVPIRVAEELAHTRSFLEKTQRGLFEAMIAEELAHGTRVVSQSPDFVAICPYASRFPYETWILPRQRSARFETSSDPLAASLGEFTRDIVGRLERTLNCPAYNYLIHTAPFDGSADDHYHWHLELFPRVTKPAGFEWGTGYYINPVAPEQAAEALRAATKTPLGKSS
jgi:UDPglucose--hexose-1-phosphate uridylyltransferase